MRDRSREVTPSQRRLLLALAAVPGGRSRLGSFKPETVRACLRKGLIVSDVPTAVTYAQAVRGRVRYYQLGVAGRAALQEDSRG